MFIKHGVLTKRRRMVKTKKDECAIMIKIWIIRLFFTKIETKECPLNLNIKS